MKKNIPSLIKKILIAIDSDAFSDHIIDYGIHLAKKMESEVDIVHIDEPPSSASFMFGSMETESSATMIELMKLQEELTQKLFKHVRDNWGGEIPLRIYGRVGKPKDEILAAAEEGKADLIIIGTHGRTGFDHFISGSVAEGVVRKAKCPVLVLPDKKEEK